MQIEISQSDPIIARILNRKLDKEGLLNAKWSKEMQKLYNGLGFLEQQFKALESATKTN